ncbi:MAG: hypothetical protein GXX82_02025 [Syntrophorhabdus sp.]|jgi:hypothetical protein|nr:hypothetical protein [Syntrophorhabdus sp.]
MNTMKNNKGFTLIELVMFIVVGGIFLPASMIAFTSVMNNYSRPDYYMKARFYAEKRVAEITNTPYDNLVPGSCSSTSEEGGKYTVECSVTSLNPDLSPSGTTSGTDPYKRIVVTVKHTGLLDGKHVISTIITRRPKKV